MEEGWRNGKGETPKDRIPELGRPQLPRDMRHEGGLVGGLAGRERLEGLGGDETEQTTEVAGVEVR